MDYEITGLPIKRFSNDNRWLSNFSLCNIEMDGTIYPSVEHAYQAAKTKVPLERLWFTDNDLTAAQAKRLSKKITIREDWNVIRLTVMQSLVSQKFDQEPYCTLLLSTGDCHIEEGNYWNDVFWGVSSQTGKGDNNLGIIIMSIRDELKSRTFK